MPALQQTHATNFTTKVLYTATLYKLVLKKTKKKVAYKCEISMLNANRGKFEIQHESDCGHKPSRRRMYRIQLGLFGFRFEILGFALKCRFRFTYA